MHWVDRGTEPALLANIRAHYTPRWVQWYRHGVGSRPTDSHWRQFHPDLKRLFTGLCAYCEEATKGEVDHFRPKGRFPRLVYSWSNWLFACHECNQAKSGAWPAGGYVDPCSKSGLGGPDSYFLFDTGTGIISPSQALNHYHRLKVERTIDDLGLNGFHHLKKRIHSLVLFSALLQADPSVSLSSTKEILQRVASRGFECSSIVSAWLSEHGYAV